MNRHSIAIIESWLRSQQSPREYILETLKIQFGADAAQTFKPTLDKIDNLQRLNQLFHAAVRAARIEDFRRTLEAKRS
ncbi:MAG: hypothetical protein OXU51_06240 [Candidatus Poribacteria bacterium]|nr:hypothetical protein [Candidatus Poribacteria bacterium]